MAVCGSCQRQITFCKACEGAKCTPGCVDRAEDGCVCTPEDVDELEADEEEEDDEDEDEDE